MKKLTAIFLLCALALSGCAAPINEPANKPAEAEKAGAPLPGRVEIEGVVAFNSNENLYMWGEPAPENGLYRIL